MKIVKYASLFVIALLVANTTFSIERNVSSDVSDLTVVQSLTAPDAVQLPVSQVVDVVPENLVQKQEQVVEKEQKSNLFTRIKTKAASAPSKTVLIILALFIPWLAVGLATDWSMSVVWNILWSIFTFGIGGIIHAIIVVNR